MKKGQTVSVEVDAIDANGAGVGSAGELRVHVPGVWPGERADVRIDHVSPHGAQAWGEPSRLTRTSPARVAPTCAAFGKCGGCVLQSLAYPAQLGAKRLLLAAALAPALAAGGVAVPGVEASPKVLGYRNKAKYVVGDAHGQRVLGSYLPRSHDLVEMLGCTVIDPALETVAQAITMIMRANGPVTKEGRVAMTAGSLRHVVLRSNAEGRVLAVLVAGREDDPDVATLARELVMRQPSMAGVVEHVNPDPGDAIFKSGAPFRALAGHAMLEDRIGRATGAIDDARLLLSAGAFFQANRDQAAHLYAAARDLADLRPTDRVLELYAGVAGIALALAPSVATVVAVEEHAGAAADARASAAVSHAANVEVVCADAAAYLAAAPPACDVAFLDPPRKGAAAAVLDALAALAPRTIVYISCNPESLARDLARLAERGYLPRAARAFDLFPHTPHIETVVALSRRP